MSLYPGYCQIQCIFYADFHPKAGSRIVYQSPVGFIDKHLFDSVSSYIITKPQLHGKLITINAHGYRFMGCPAILNNPQKYERNALMFNFVFVFKADVDTTQYESVARKLSMYMSALEKESGYLYQASCSVDTKSCDTSGNTTPATLNSSAGSTTGLQGPITQQSMNSAESLPMQLFLDTLCTNLNDTGVCEININDFTLIHLEIMTQRKDPPTVESYEVPIVTPFAQKFVDPDVFNFWCPTIKQLMPYIDGKQTVLAIATLADMEIKIVQTCLQSLVYYDVVRMISAFQYSNEYTTTPQIGKLLSDQTLQEDCLNYISNGHCKVTVRDALNLYSKLRAGTTIKSLCTLHTPHRCGIDEVKLIQFGLLHQLIRRLHKYPVTLPRTNIYVRQQISDEDSLQRFYDGCHSFDEICCRLQMSTQELEERIEKDSTVIVLQK